MSESSVPPGDEADATAVHEAAPVEAAAPSPAADPPPAADAPPAADPPPAAEPAAGWDAGLSGGSGEALAERPEVLVGAAFAGGVLSALILKRLAR